MAVEGRAEAEEISTGAEEEIIIIILILFSVQAARTEPGPRSSTRLTAPTSRWPPAPAASLTPPTRTPDPATPRRTPTRTGSPLSPTTSNFVLRKSSGMKLNLKYFCSFC